MTYSSINLSLHLLLLLPLSLFPLPSVGPTQAPMRLYASKVKPLSVTINWRYDENPPVGNLVGFYISYYLQDERNPSQNGAPIRENLFHEVDNPNQMDFSYLIDEFGFLSSGTSYNVYIAAVTDTVYGGGAGSEASMSFTTQRDRKMDHTSC